jgi:hypothetical protein
MRSFYFFSFADGLAAGLTAAWTMTQLLPEDELLPVVTWSSLTSLRSRAANLKMCDSSEGLESAGCAAEESLVARNCIELLVAAFDLHRPARYCLVPAGYGLSPFSCVEPVGSCCLLHGSWLLHWTCMIMLVAALVAAVEVQLLQLLASLHHQRDVPVGRGRREVHFR